MLIDPFVVVAQLVNFGLLVWLLRRLLFGPITRVMAAREARIREEVEAARQLRLSADADGERYRALLADFAAERESRLAGVRAEVDELRQREIREARAEIKALRERWRHAVAQEKEAFLRELRVRVGQESVAVIRRAFEDLADDDLEDRVVARFIERVRTMSVEDRASLAAAAREDGHGFRLTTAFPASDRHRTALATVLAATFDVDTPPRFETNPDIVAGVELSAGGVKVAWTLEDFLQTFEQAMREVLDDSDADTRSGGGGETGNGGKDRGAGDHGNNSGGRGDGPGRESRNRIDKDDGDDA